MLSVFTSSGTLSAGQRVGASTKYKKLSLITLVFILTTLMSISCSFANENCIGGYFEPSGYHGNSAGYYYWVNYCPLCHHHGTLQINPKGTYEEEVTCSHCDADFDGTSGADKYVGGVRAWLKPYNGVINGHVIKDGVFQYNEIQAQSVVNTEYVEITFDNQIYKVNKQKLEKLEKAID